MTSVVPAAGVVSFARGVPGPELLPADALAAAAAVPREALNYGPPGGYAPLREWLAERHGVEPGRVLLTPGSMLGLNLLLAELVRPDDEVIVESPSYDRTRAALAAAGAVLVAARRDATGIDLDAVEAAAGAARLLYVLPTFHNPTGTTLPAAQRRELARIAVEHELLVVEDDPYGELRFEGEPEPSLLELLRELGAERLAVRVSSFSKSVAPGLRVGYLILPAALARRLERRALDAYVSPPLLPQAQLLQFLLAGALEPHLATLRVELRRRRDALAAGLDAALPGAARTQPEGGYFLWLELPHPLDAAALLAEAVRRGVEFVTGAGFGGGERTARLAFSHPSPELIAEGCRRLGTAAAALA